jgi:hypothetical protein
MTGGTKMAPFEPKRQYIFMVTIIAFDPGQTTAQITTIPMAINHRHHVGSPEALTSFITIIAEQFQFFKMRLGALEIITGPQI